MEWIKMPMLKLLFKDTAFHIFVYTVLKKEKIC
jgi:hypothetical protein